MSKLDVSEILDRTKQALDVPSDSAFAKSIGVSPEVVYNWRRRGSMDWPLVVRHVHEAGKDLRWVLFGEESESGVRRMVIRTSEGEKAVDLSSAVSMGFE